MTHYHWLLWAYRARLDNGDYQDVTTIDVLAESYEEARGRAEKLVPLTVKGGAKNGAGYRLVQVVEHLDGACGVR